MGPHVLLRRQSHERLHLQLRERRQARPGGWRLQELERRASNVLLAQRLEFKLVQQLLFYHELAKQKLEKPVRAFHPGQ